MKSVILEKKDGFIKNLDISKEAMNFIKNNKDQMFIRSCVECDNCQVDSCPKITEEERTIIDQAKNHLCADCANCYPSKCPKVNDQFKKLISQYDFIKDGFEVFDENGQLDRFIVNDCARFIEDAKKELTSDQKRHLRNNRKSIMMEHFAAEDVDQAILTLVEQIDNGVLDVHLSESEIELYRRKASTVKKERAKKELEDSQAEWLSKEEIEKLSSIAKDCGREEFGYELNEIRYQNHQEKKEKMLGKIR